ncbi:MAG: hypothetical protein II008_09745 [Oscillospiraceae bacterium]|nr:hypothetical protein [Oscillospiraceae bacterium]
MNEYKIYQVKREHMREYGFCGLREILWTHPGMQGLPREAWEQVYVYRTEKEPSLDWLYSLFNRGYEPEPGMATPEDFTGRSMSVSDIVETPDGKLWFCDSFGWREVQWNGEAG